MPLPIRPPEKSEDTPSHPPRRGVGSSEDVYSLTLLRHLYRAFNNLALKSLIVIAVAAVAAAQMIFEAPLTRMVAPALLVSLVGSLVKLILDVFRYRFGIQLNESLKTLVATRRRILKKPISARDEAISLAYLHHIKKRNSGQKLALIVLAFFFYIAFIKTGNQISQAFSLVNMIAWILITVKEMVVEYRIGCGYFGTNQVEAREILRFIVERSDDIDFTDGSGKPRRALLPDKSQGDKRHAAPSGSGVPV